MTIDIYGHALAFDANGMLSSVAGGAETYTYDAQGNRVEVHGSTVTDYIYFGGAPIAMLNGGAYTDLIYAGGTLIAEVGGTQSAVPTYRVTDNLDTLAGDAPSSGSIAGAVNYAAGWPGLSHHGSSMGCPVLSPGVGEGRAGM
jgi:YD repeat-containing protein